MRPPVTALLLAFAIVAGAQDPPGSHPMKSLSVAGLPNADGAKVILIRAKGADCSQSALLLLSDLEPQTYADPYQAKSLFAPPANALRASIGSHVDSGCWCEDKNAGIAVLAPDRAVTYIPNERNFRKPNAAEKLKQGNQDLVPFYRLCAKSEMRVEMRPNREVPVMVWAADNAAQNMAKDDIANADWILDKELTGITLRPVYRVVKADPAEADVSTPNETRQPLKRRLAACYSSGDADECCNAAAASNIFSPGGLNIYYGAADTIVCGATFSIQAILKGLE